LGAGGDIIDGGKGVDRLSISYSPQPIEKVFLDGRASKGGNAEGAKITNFEIFSVLSGDVDIVGAKIGEEITGSSGKNTILGNGGNDILNGRSGDDILKGGKGKDVLIGDDGA